MIIDVVGGQPKDNLGKLMCIWQALSAVTFRVKKARDNQGCQKEPGPGDFPQLLREWPPATFIGK